MSLNINKTAKILADEYITYSTSAPYNISRHYLDFLQSKLDKGFQEATESLKNFIISPPAGSLYINQIDPHYMPEEIGRACAEYWVKAIGFGKPEACNNIDSVINDAAKIANPIAQELRTLRYMKSLSRPYYYKFVEIIYRNIKTIIWTIEESDSDCGSTFTGNIT